MYTKDHPFLATLKSKKSLCHEGSSKKTLHVVIDLKGEALPYKAGDSVAIFPENNARLVSKTLSALKMSGNEVIVDKRSLKEITLKEYLTKKGSITNFSRKLLGEVVTKAKGDELEDPKKFINEHHVWDLLTTYPQADFTPQEIADLLMPLLPRFYSIASSPLVSPTEIHLTVAHLKYYSNDQEREGVCTDYLCEVASLGTELPLYIQPAHGFVLPENKETSIIMIGPGTGVAPFRAFMQERELSGATGKNWLFFGERTRSHEFFYEEEWRRWEDLNMLTLDLAFSREQPEKIYVQDRLKEKGAEVIKWLEAGAILYLCGDADHMAKGVEHALSDIIRQETSFDPPTYLKSLKKEGRYLKDVY